MKAQFIDRFKLTDEDFASVETGEGYLIVNARISRSGIYKYNASELGFDQSEGVVNVYRPPSEVFDSVSLSSFALKPVTDDHPPVLVNSENHDIYSKGTSGDRIFRDWDSDHVRAKLRIHDKELIGKVKSGKVEVSNGYMADIIELDEETLDEETGETYRFVQKNIIGNHIAIVDFGRAGSSCRVGINDSLFPNKKIEVNKNIEKMKRTIVIDGLNVELDEQGAQIATKALADRDSKISTLETKISEDKATFDKDLAKKDLEIEDLKNKVLTDSEIELKVKTRSEFLNKVSLIDSNLKTEGKSTEDIKKEVVASKFPSIDLADKSSDYISALFDNIDVKQIRDAKEVNNALNDTSKAGTQEDDPAAKYYNQ